MPGSLRRTPEGVDMSNPLWQQKFSFYSRTIIRFLSNTPTSQSVCMCVCAHGLMPACQWCKACKLVAGGSFSWGGRGRGSREAEDSSRKLPSLHVCVGHHPRPRYRHLTLPINKGWCDGRQYPWKHFRLFNALFYISITVDRIKGIMYKLDRQHEIPDVPPPRLDDNRSPTQRRSPEMRATLPAFLSEQRHQ